MRADVSAAIADFCQRVPELAPPTEAAYTFAELLDAAALKRLPWSQRPGIYCYFRGNGEICYVGRAMLASGLATRVSDHVQSHRRGRPEWDEVLDDPEAFGVIYAFKTEDEVWIPSLEVALIARFWDIILNDRRA